MLLPKGKTQTERRHVYAVGLWIGFTGHPPGTANRPLTSTELRRASFWLDWAPIDFQAFKRDFEMWHFSTKIFLTPFFLYVLCSKYRESTF